MSEKLFFGSLAAVVLTIILLVYKQYNLEYRMFSQCVQDGKKEYECYGMVKSCGGKR